LKKEKVNKMITPEKMTVIINVKMFFEKLGNTEKNVFEKLEKRKR